MNSGDGRATPSCNLTDDRVARNGGATYDGKQLPMKRFVAVLTAWIWLGSVTGLLPAVGLASGDTLWVFKHDGTVHCGPSAGIAPDVMAQELAASGIPVLAMRKGHDGREGIALCGQPTGQVNLYEVPAVKLSQALAAGFRLWTGSSRSPDEGRKAEP